eukprot:scaffold138784_cov32-Tisochrysis_lutea.AAC.2
MVIPTVVVSSAAVISAAIIMSPTIIVTLSIIITDAVVVSPATKPVSAISTSIILNPAVPSAKPIVEAPSAVTTTSVPPSTKVITARLGRATFEARHLGGKHVEAAVWAHPVAWPDIFTSTIAWATTISAAITASILAKVTPAVRAAPSSVVAIVAAVWLDASKTIVGTWWPAAWQRRPCVLSHGYTETAISHLLIIAPLNGGLRLFLGGISNKTEAP